jgi:predicted phosphodiesterase
MRWSYRQLDGETLDFIAELPEQRVVAVDGTAPIRVVHGSPRSSSERLYPERDPMALAWFREADLLPPDRDRRRLERVLEGMGEPVLVCGHTHIPWVEHHGHRLALNPGAVSLSFDGDVRAHYALLTWEDGAWEVEQRAVAYDVDRIRRGFRRRGFLAEGGAFARAMLLTVESGQNVIGHLFSHIDRLAVGAGLEDWVVVPDALWKRAVESFDWDAYGRARQPCDG